MRRYIKSILYTFLALFVLLTSFVVFLLNTTPGFYLLLQLADLRLPGKFEINKLEGSFLERGVFQEFNYIGENFDLKLHNARIAWELSDLFHKKLTIKDLNAEEVTVIVKKGNKDSDFKIKLPLTINLKKAIIKKFSLINPKQTIVFNNLSTKAQLMKRQWYINHLNFDFLKTSVSLKGQFTPKIPYSSSGEIHVSYNKDIPVKADITFKGDKQLYSWSGKLEGSIVGSLAGHVKNLNDLYTELTWQDISLPANTITIANNCAVGTCDQKRSFGSGHLILQGTTSNFTVNAEGETFLPTKANWEINSKVTDGSSVTQTKIQLVNRQLPLTGTITTDANKLTAQLFLDTNKVELSKNFTKPTWHLDFTFPKPAQLTPALTGVKTTVTGTATINSAQHGNIALQIGPGSYQSKEEEQAPVINFYGGKITAQLSAKQLEMQGVVNLEQKKDLIFNLMLPDFNLPQLNAEKQKIKGTVNLQLSSFTFFDIKNHLVENPQANLNLNLLIKGTLSKPIFTGEASLTQGSVALPKLNLLLHPIEIKLKTTNKKWELIGFIVSENKTIHLSGTGNLFPFNGQVKIQGDNFPAMRSAEYTFNVSPNLLFTISRGNMELTGDILVPTGRLKPISFSNTVNLSDDVVFVSAKKNPMPFNLKTNINVIMGNDVAIAVKGMQGFLEGSIQLKQAPYSDFSAFGELSIRDGKYQAYGQNLNIEQGQLFFSGSAISNPTIRIRAVRTLNTASNDFAGSNQLFDFNVQNLQNLDYGAYVKVGIQISGRINSPKVSLFSIPSNLSQADILSLLLLGVPANQASKSGGQLLLTAISNMNLDSGTKGMQLLEQLKQSLGVDFNIQNTTEVNQRTKQLQEGTAFVVSKSLSKRLYLSYNIGLDQDSNLLILKYLLNKFWSIQVSTSDIGSGIDLLYTHHKE
ncbi:periplasmic protein (plasmid) [Legionella adelaidensis]|uniref:Periplasmic protein n=1 Tax=Legionella adelaidensis TaxID=45056 RepID=A0A0W0R3G6_9GAMM|nr:translocation/assembly module TamB [Legionella adelaidensis]KTC65622.1 periplasmic protein [Legionella adelaidensis]VEH85181.1 periplasmic protein [Legionella adelaidensis]